MKTYKINGKEIKGFEGRIVQTDLGVGLEMPVIESKFNELLEALSDKEESKQPISLGVEIERIVRLHTHEDRVDEADIAEDVLSLIHSHLIKETETLEPSKYVQMDDACLEGYNICKNDIIKIINNITK